MDNKTLPDHLRQVNGRLAIRLNGFRWYVVGPNMLRLSNASETISRHYGRLATGEDMEVAEKTRLWDAEVPNFCGDDRLTWEIVRLFQRELRAHLTICGGIPGPDPGVVGYSALFTSEQIEQLPFAASTPSVAICVAADHWLQSVDTDAWFVVKKTERERKTVPQNQLLMNPLPAPMAALEQIGSRLGVWPEPHGAPTNVDTILQAVSRLVRDRNALQKMLDHVATMTQSAKKGTLGARVHYHLTESSDALRMSIERLETSSK